MCSRGVWTNKWAWCFVGLQRGVQENPYEKDWGLQGPGCDGDDVRCPFPMLFAAAKRSFQGPWVCAAAQLKDSTWLEELVSESNTIQAQEGITQAGLSTSNNGVKLYRGFGWFFVRIFGLISSFGPALCMDQ